MKLNLGKVSLVKKIVIGLACVAAWFAGDRAMAYLWDSSPPAPTSQKIEQLKWSATFPNTAKQTKFMQAGNEAVMELTTIGSDEYSIVETQYGPGTTFDLDRGIDSMASKAGRMKIESHRVVINGLEGRHFTVLFTGGGATAQLTGLTMFKDGLLTLVLATDSQGNNADRSKAFLDSFALK